MEGGADLTAEPPAPEGGLGAWERCPAQAPPTQACELEAFSGLIHNQCHRVRTVSSGQCRFGDPLMSPSRWHRARSGGDGSFPVGQPQLRLLAEGGLVTGERGGG